MAAASVSRSAFCLEACGLWQETQPAPVVTGLWGFETRSAMGLWHPVQRPLPSTRVSFLPTAACGSWQETQSPRLKGACSTLPPAASPAESWQPPQSFAPVSWRPNGFAAVGGVWQESQPDRTAWTEPLSSLGCSAEWGSWQREQVALLPTGYSPWAFWKAPAHGSWHFEQSFTSSVTRRFF